MKTFKELADEYCSDQQKLRARYETRAARLGFAVGAVVQNTDGIYRITRLYSREKMVIYGVKLRRNGTFGTHEHYVSHHWGGVWPYREAA